MVTNIPKTLIIDQEFINKDEENKLLEWIKTQKPNTTISRRTWHYGYEYNYKSKNKKYIGNIPDELIFLCNRLKTKNYFSIIPNQIIINEYLPGQGINAHIDSLIFEDTIATLSLLSPIEMEFKYKTNEFEEYLLPRSLYVMKDDMRYKYTHCIRSRLTDRIIKEDNIYKKDEVMNRKTRYSITFRNVL